MGSDLPTGTVILLFTDIEGSTRLLHELGPERYAETLAEHRRIVRDAFAAHGGVEIDTQGDAFFYAFARASEGLAAAEAGQRALGDGPVRVRMGVHTGEPTVTEEGYVGADVHLAARVMGAGHGGQVLVSEATARLVEAGLRDLGEHRLKDLERPVRLFQLGAGGFPPLKTLNNSHLPLPATPLLGRKKELADVLRLLRVERVRLVTVTGPGGIGKTRFALEAAHELVEEFAHGVWFVDLSALRDPALVMPTVAATLGAGGDLVEHVAEKELLLVLDNFEQVVDAAADVAELLRRCPNVQLLITSRESLRVAGERAYPLKPLAESPAVELFRVRAEAADPDFDAPWDTLTAVVDRLDRLPLAIELAAARVQALGANELLQRLEHRLPLLRSRSRDRPERQRTLRAAIEWSYDLLEEDEQQLFRRLSVFASGCTLEAANTVCDANVDALEALVDKNLVRFRNGRYSMLETIREVAAERLAGDPGQRLVRTRFAAYFTRLVIQESAQLGYLSHGGVAAMELFAAEVDNLRAAFRWLLDEGDATEAAELAGRLSPFWLRSNRWPEARAWVEAALGRSDEIAPEMLAQLRYLGARAASFADDEPRMLELNAAAEVDARVLGDNALLGRVLFGRGDAALERGDVNEASDAFAQAHALAATAGDEWGLGFALSGRALAARAAGDAKLAGRFLEEAIAHARAHQAMNLPPILRVAADVSLGQGDYARAFALYRESLEIGATGRQLVVVESAMAGMAAAAAARGDRAVAGRLWGFVGTLDTRPRPLAPELKGHINRIADDPAFRDAFAAGERATLDEAVEYALSLHST